jgi:hypothetical protein
MKRLPRTLAEYVERWIDFAVSEEKGSAECPFLAGSFVQVLKCHKLCRLYKFSRL